MAEKIIKEIKIKLYFRRTANKIYGLNKKEFNDYTNYGVSTYIPKQVDINKILEIIFLYLDALQKP